MARPRTRPTVLVRMSRNLKNELEHKFPELDMPSRLDAVYRISAARFEGALRDERLLDNMRKEFSNKPKKRFILF